MQFKLYNAGEVDISTRRFDGTVVVLIHEPEVQDDGRAAVRVAAYTGPVRTDGTRRMIAYAMARATAPSAPVMADAIQKALAVVKHVIETTELAVKVEPGARVLRVLVVRGSATIWADAYPLKDGGFNVRSGRRTGVHVTSAGVAEAIDVEPSAEDKAHALVVAQAARDYLEAHPLRRAS